MAKKLPDCTHSFETNDFEGYISSVPFNYCPWCGKDLKEKMKIDRAIQGLNNEDDCLKGGCAD